MAVKNILRYLAVTALLTVFLFASEPAPEYFTRLIVEITPLQIKEYEQLAENGDAKSQLIIGLLKRKSRNERMKSYQNGEEAIAWIERSAKQGYAPSQHFLVEICSNEYNEGIGEIKICREIKPILEKAVASNYPAAVWYEGYYWQIGKYGERDLSKAIASYKRAGSLGYAYAYYSIGKIFEEGIGVNENQKEANVWYLKGAENGDATAQDTLAVRISEGIGTKSNNRLAVEWFKKSAEQGHVYGTCNLGIHYARGWGIAKNKLLALKWAFISNAIDGLKCDPGDFVELLKPKAVTMEQARSLALSWLRAHPKLTNNFDERPWLDDGEFPLTSRER